jgi:hypothetical protein
LVQVEIFEEAVDLAQTRAERGPSGLLEDVQRTRSGGTDVGAPARKATPVQVARQRFSQLLAQATR